MKLPGHKRKTPVRFRASVVRKILAGLAEGKTLAETLRQRGLPDRRTVTSWQQRYPDFRQAVATARAIGADALAETMLSDLRTLAERGRQGQLKRDEVAAHRELAGAIKWLLARWASDRYGDVKPHPQTTITIHSTLSLPPQSPAETADTGDSYRAVALIPDNSEQETE